MAKFITVISVISSVASILGFVYIYLPKKSQRKKFNKIVFTTFSVTLLFSIYLLFGPTTFLEKNIESKITYYVEDKNEENILIEEGEFIYTGMGEQSITYYIPYKNTPSVEIINMNGYNGAPTINKVTENQFIVSRNFTTGQSNEKYKWIARGKPLKEMQSK